MLIEVFNKQSFVKQYMYIFLHTCFVFNTVKQNLITYTAVSVVNQDISKCSLYLLKTICFQFMKNYKLKVFQQNIHHHILLGTDV